MKFRYAVLFAAFLLISGSLFAESDAIDYFLDLRLNTFAMMPESFTGELTGDSIEEKLETIPEDYIEDDGAYTELSFSQSDGLEIVVKNVYFLYEDLFEQYVRFFTLGPLLSTQSDAAVLARYEMEFTEYAEKIILDLRYQSADNYYEIYFDAETYEVFRVDYYMDEELFSSVLIQYKDVTDGGETYSIPAKFFVKTIDDDVETLEIFEIENISVN